MLELFTELDQELVKSSTRADMYLVGGAAMALAYDARDLEADWLNDGVKGFLPGDDRGERRVVFEGDALTVSAASPEYLLATKLLASRAGRDEDDIRLLYQIVGFTTVDEGLAVLARYYPGRPIEAKVQFFLEELLES
jgi:hypothetical protein